MISYRKTKNLKREIAYKRDITFKNKHIPYFELNFYIDLKRHLECHLFDKLVIVALEDGELKIEKSSGSFILKKEAILLINPFETYNISQNSAKNIYFVYLDNEFLKKFQKELFCIDDYIPFLKSIIENKRLYVDFLNLCKEILSNSLIYEKEEMILDFISNLMIEQIDVKLGFKSSDILACDIRRYIDKHITSDLMLDRLSKEFLISPFHLIKIFKSELGLTPRKYIVNQRLNRAKELLQEDSNISRVATQVGFLDQSHLYKYFKDVFGVTPKEYINSLENNSSR